MSRIGSNLLIEEALNRIQFEDAVPVLEYKGFVYHIDYTGRKFGNLYYTKFEMDMVTPIHSVEMPFSKTYTVGELIDRGEGLRKKIAPKIEELPPLSFAVVECKTETIIKKNV